MRRLVGVLATLLAVSLITFVMLESTPGDAAAALAGESASTAQIDALRSQLGLDQSLPARYSGFLSNLIVHGDLGRSLISARPVVDLLMERLPYTMLLACAATALAGIVGVGIGVGAAARRGTILEPILMSGAALGLALPTFWVALLLMLLFSVRLRLLPVVGADGPLSLVLPAVTLAMPTAAAIARLMRTSLVDVWQSDYVRTAHSKGLPSNRVLTRHVLRNCLIPIVTVLSLHLGYLLSGAFVVETIFGWPGIGRMSVQAIFDRDYPVVMGTTLTVAIIYVLLNLAVDILHGWLDPEVAHQAI